MSHCGQRHLYLAAFNSALSYIPRLHLPLCAFGGLTGVLLAAVSAGLLSYSIFLYMYTLYPARAQGPFDY